MPFRLPDLTKCCCCFKLRTGALIIGYYSAVSILLTMLGNIALLVMVSQVASDKPPPANSTAQHIDKSTAVKIYVSYGLQLVVLTVHFAFTLMLIIGTHKNIPRYMRYYFILGGVTLMVNLVFITITAIFNGFVATFMQLLGCAIQFYFLLVVRSAALEMVESQKPPGAPDTEMGTRPIPMGAPAPAPGYYQEQAAPLMPKPNVDSVN